MQNNNMKKQYKSKGIAFPIKIINGRIEETNLEEHVRQSIIMILKTTSGERIMRSEYGSNLIDFVFMPFNTTTITLVKNTIYEALLKYEPRINVLDVIVKKPAQQPWIMNIEIEYVIKELDEIKTLLYTISSKEEIISVKGNLNILTKVIKEKDDAIFSYEVTNTGNVDLSNIVTRIKIYKDSDLELIETLSNTNDIKINESIKINKIWNQNPNKAGIYTIVLEAMLLDGQIIELDRDKLIIEKEIIRVEGNLNVLTKVIKTNETASFSYEVKNTGNVDLSNVVTKIQIYKGSNMELKHTITQTNDIKVNDIININKNWDNTSKEAGEYTVILEANLPYGQIVELDRENLIVEKVIIKVEGELNVLTKVIKTNETASFSYKVKNTGNVDLSNVVTKIQIYKDLNMELIHTIIQTNDININEIININKYWDTIPKEAGKYIVILEAELSNEQIVELDRGSLIIEKEIEYNAFDFLFYSSSQSIPLKINSSYGYFYGDLHSNFSAEFAGTLIQFYGKCNVVNSVYKYGWSINISEINEDVKMIDMPYIADNIKQIALRNVKPYTNNPYYKISYNIENSIINTGRLDFYCFNFKSKGYIVANNNIRIKTHYIYNGNENGIVICSENGDITIDARDINFKGIIYAPNGKVKIQCDNDDNKIYMTAKIVAKSIEINAYRQEIYSLDNYNYLIDPSI